MSSGKDVVHWPVLALTSSLAGFVVAGMIGLGWALTRPAHARQLVVIEASRPLPQTAPEILARAEFAAEGKPGAPEAESADVRKASPDFATDHVAEFKKAAADPATPVQVRAEQPAPALLVTQLAKEEPAAACGVHGTTLRFARSPTAAAREAQEQDKLLMVMHISGHFEDAAFT